MSSSIEIVLMAMLALMMVICYSLLVIASKAEERAERMYRKWKESKGADDE